MTFLGMCHNYAKDFVDEFQREYNPLKDRSILMEDWQQWKNRFPNYSFGRFEDTVQLTTELEMDKRHEVRHVRVLAMTNLLFEDQFMRFNMNRAFHQPHMMLVEKNTFVGMVHPKDRADVYHRLSDFSEIWIDLAS